MRMDTLVQSLVENINGYGQEFKTIITDWSDAKSPRPDVDDFEFPVKTVLYLADPRAEHADKTKTIFKKLKGRSKSVVIGGVLENDWSEEEAAIYMKDLRKKGLNPVPRITIAFAGGRIKSATHIIDSGVKFEKRLRDFKLELRFSIVDSRVIGFLIYNTKPMDMYPDNAMLTISKLFPHVVIFRMCMKKILQPPEDSYTRMVLHLVRF